MATIELEKQCACFKKSGIKIKDRFDSIEDAKKEAEDICNDMNTDFCLRHYFEPFVEDDKIIIKVSVRG